MGEPTAFHRRTSALCSSLAWKEWAGYLAVCHYGSCHHPEYHAFRHAAGLLDVSPLFKYDIEGSDSLRFLSRIMSRDIGTLRVGRATYCCWCDEQGKVIDDGTIAHLSRGRYRVTSANPALRWFEINAEGMAVEITDTARQVAALALQGPNAARILRSVCGPEIDKLRFFGVSQTRIGGVEGVITRTGFTGDLGYELWVDRNDAVGLWDSVMNAGEPYRLVPVGLDALDMTRLEAGFVLIDVDFRSSRWADNEEQRYSPYEVGLGWTVQLDREWFVGRDALRREKAAGGPPRRLVGIESSYTELEALFERHDLPPNLPSEAWRTPVPLYGRTGQVGKATSGTWSPLLKKNIALGIVPTRLARPGKRLWIETTVEATRYKISARVVERPFFDPPRKRKCPPA